MGKALRKRHWQNQGQLDFVSVGDFSYYDQVLDMSFMLGNIPARVQGLQGNELDNYFRLARGRSAVDKSPCCVNAGEMTKWFDTNYHYIVPEFEKNTSFTLHANNLLQQIEEAQKQGHKVKPVLIGPVTYLWLGKSKDASNKLDFLDDLLNVYGQLLSELAIAGIEWVQIDEPILVMELAQEWQHAMRKAYYQLQNSALKILLATYFGQLQENLQLACDLPVAGQHLDAINARDEVLKIVDWLPNHKVLSLGIIDGRNIWKTELSTTLDWLEPIYIDYRSACGWRRPARYNMSRYLSSEKQLDDKIKPWLAFAIQKLDELGTLTEALHAGRDRNRQAKS